MRYHIIPAGHFFTGPKVISYNVNLLWQIQISKLEHYTLGTLYDIFIYCRIYKI